MDAPRKPEPKHVETVCDVCGLDWKRHGKAPTTEKCIELLKADLASEKQRTTPYQPALPQPYPVPYPVPQPLPWPRPYNPRPWYQPPLWSTTPAITTSGTQISAGTNYTVKPVNH